jgi:MFS family permease
VEDASAEESAACGSPSPAFPGPERLRDNPYDAAFWKAFLANFLVTVSVAVLFRYADFITFLDGTELHLGWIVGIGMVGSLSMRLFVGTRIDRHGPRSVWLFALLVLVLTFFAHLLITRHGGANIREPSVAISCAVLRIAMLSSLAGVYASSMTFISGRVSVIRMAELLGMLGSSGFLGIVLGTWLSDLLLNGQSNGSAEVDRMFLAAGLLGLAGLVSAWWATAGYVHPAPRRRPPLWGLIRRYHPGRVMVMGIAMGFGLGLPTIFVRAFAAELHIPRIGMFFTVYSLTAIATRVLARRLPERLGLRPVALIGLWMLVGSQFLFLLVRTEWGLLLPSIFYGMAHAILFPAGFAEGCCAFPSRYRGLGTSLMMATYDIGQLIGAPTAGLLVHFGAKCGLPGYPTMFVGVAILLALATSVYMTAPRPPRPAARRS